MGTVIVVTSGKGGVGKSTVTAGLGVQLTRQGRRVLLIDMDEGLRALDMMLGVSASLVFDIADILNGNCNAYQAVLQVPVCAGLYLLPAPVRPGAVESAEAMRALCGRLSAVFDYILVDCPAGIDRGFAIAVSAADNALVVATPDPVCVRDAATVAQLLQKQGVEHRRLVINRVNTRLMLDGVFYNIDEMIDATGLQLIAAIPADDEVTRSGAQGRPLTDGYAAAALSNLAQRLQKKQVPLLNLKKIC